MMLIVSGAYGRDYATPEAAIADWNAGKDFRNHTITIRGAYCSKRDVTSPLKTIKSIKIRYNKMRDFILLDLAGNPIPDQEL